jgi:hypothetical protein
MYSLIQCLSGGNNGPDTRLAGDDQNVRPHPQRKHRRGPGSLEPAHQKRGLRQREELASLAGWTRGNRLCAELAGDGTLWLPDFFLASADELIDAQYADRPQLRPIYDAIINVALGLGEIVIQARKTYVSLVTPRRTFAHIQPTTKTRLDLSLRLEGQKPGGRLQPSKIQESMRLQISLTSPEEVDSEVLHWLQVAYEQNS